MRRPTPGHGVEALTPASRRNNFMAPLDQRGHDVTAHEPGRARDDDLHASHLTSGTATAKRPPQARMREYCAATSSAMFQGRISTTSGFRASISSGATMGTWLPGRYFPCLAAAASQTYGSRSGFTPAKFRSVLPLAAAPYAASFTPER